MCQTSRTMVGDGLIRVDRHVLRDMQRRAKTEAVLGSNRISAAAADGMRTPSPQRKSNLCRSGNQGKENKTPPAVPVQPIQVANAVAGPSSPSPTKRNLLGTTKSSQEGPRYTSLSELVVTIPSSPFGSSENFGTSSPMPLARTPLKDALVEKAVQAYLQPSDSFNDRRRHSDWGTCLVWRQFMPTFITKLPFTMPNPIQFFCCAAHALGIYLTRRSMPLELMLRSQRSGISGAS